MSSGAPTTCFTKTPASAIQDNLQCSGYYAATLKHVDVSSIPLYNEDIENGHGSIRVVCDISYDITICSLPRMTKDSRGQHRVLELGSSV